MAAAAAAIARSSEMPDHTIVSLRVFGFPRRRSVRDRGPRQDSPKTLMKPGLVVQLQFASSDGPCCRGPYPNLKKQTASIPALSRNTMVGEDGQSPIEAVAAAARMMHSPWLVALFGRLTLTRWSRPAPRPRRRASGQPSFPPVLCHGVTPTSHKIGSHFRSENFYIHTCAHQR